MIDRVALLMIGCFLLAIPRQPLAMESSGELCDDDPLQTQCATWAEEGECHENPEWMSEHCTRSCGLCPMECPTVMCMPLDNCVEYRLKRSDEGCETCQCDVTCPAGMIWNSCGSRCNSTCSDPLPMCTRECVARCECPPGTVLHEGECITMNQCPCPAEQVFNECGSACTKTCDQPNPMCIEMCVAKCECPSSSPIWHNESCITEAECPQRLEECDGGKIYNECGSACPRTCENPNPPCTKQCERGCHCPNDMPIWHEGQCIAESACPAEPQCTGGQIYNECGSACPRTCENPNQPCTRQCSRGCHCPNDMPIWHEGQCIAESACPEPQCTGGQIWVECGSACNMTCEDRSPSCDPPTCVPRCQCPRERPIFHNGQCISPFDCPRIAPECPPTQVWQECGKPCTPTCDQPIMPCPAMCQARCECPSDKPLMLNDRCISIDECPDPCSIGSPLRNNNTGRTVFCGRGPSRVDCPDTHVCNIHPADGGAVCCEKATGGPCHLHLQSTWLGGFMVGMFVPQCNKDGSYKAMQCHSSTGYCWCVDENGEEIEGSKVPPGQGIPECTDDVTEEPCPDLDCPTGCTEEDGPDGCPKCNCEDPCNLVDCFPGYSCINKPVQCVTEPCWPQAVCIPDLCFSPMDVGGCDEADYREEKWHFNPETLQCDTFMYMACGGNENNFDTEEECMNMCMPASFTCPEVMCDVTCPHGYKKSSEGCDMCVCMDSNGEECPPFECDKECRFGYKTDMEGCGMCECACSQMQCRMACPYGFDVDEHGCEICRCVLPCQDVNCTEGSRCIHKPVQCVTTPCYPEPLCIPDSCFAPMDSGGCDDADYREERWHFNPRTLECETFMYMTCGGNENNFATQEECMNMCMPTSFTCPEIRCDLACPKGFEQDSDGCDMCQCAKSDECPPLVCDKGCQFGYVTDADGCDTCQCACSKMQCRMYCEYGYEVDEHGCELCQCVWPCKGVSCEDERYECLASVAPCLVEPCPYFGVCKPKLEYLPEVCMLPLLPGECSESHMRYYFDSEERECLRFEYTGCEGNENNFDTREECQSHCNVTSATNCSAMHCPQDCAISITKDENGCSVCDCEEPVCDPLECDLNCTYGLKMDDFSMCPVCECQCSPIMCMMYCPHGFEMNDEGCDICKCREEPSCSNHECDEGETCIQPLLPCMSPRCPQEYGPPTCVPCGLPRQCTAPKDAGPCRAAFRRWYYDARANECLQFIYGGCRGNENNYETLADCESACHVNLCPAEEGDCGITECRHGLVYNEEEGCYLRRCAGRPCIECAESCQFGFATDDQGCDLCDQCYDPCVGMECGMGEVCVPASEGCEYDWCTSPDILTASCQPRRRPGTCPDASAVTSQEQTTCENDAICESGQKCCMNSMGAHVCAASVLHGACGSPPSVTLPDVSCADTWTYNADIEQCVHEDNAPYFVTEGNKFCSQAECEAVCKCPTPPEQVPSFCEFGHVLDDYGCRTSSCRHDPCIAMQCLVGTACEHRPVDPSCEGECRKTAACIPLSMDKKNMVCDQRHRMFFESLCPEMCDPEDESTCPTSDKCCNTGCGHACMKAVNPTFDRLTGPCSKDKMRALMTMEADPTRPVVVPFCDHGVLWEPVQCNLYLGVCWCVEQETGLRIAGTQVRGTPVCDVSMVPDSNQQDEPVCVPGQEVLTCSPLLCYSEFCPARPTAQCRVRPCGDSCKFEWFDGDRLVTEECFTGTYDCQASIQNSLRDLKASLSHNMEHSNNTAREFVAYFATVYMRVKRDVMNAQYGRGQDVSPPERPNEESIDLPDAGERPPPAPRGDQLEDADGSGSEEQQQSSSSGMPNKLPHNPPPSGLEGMQHIAMYLPTCRPPYDDFHGGYHFKQCHLDYCWCVDHTGEAHQGSLTPRAQVLTCTPSGRDPMKSSPTFTCPSGEPGQICTDPTDDEMSGLAHLLAATLTIAERLKGNMDLPHVRLYADPCNGCRQMLKDGHGNDVTLENLMLSARECGTGGRHCVFHRDGSSNLCSEQGASNQPLYAPDMLCASKADDPVKPVCMGEENIEQMCGDTCSTAVCTGYPEAQCVVDPCTCQPQFMDMTNRNIINCEETMGMCQRYNSAVRKTQMKPDNALPKEPKMMYSCDEAGGFEKQQCFGNQCWCVRQNGEEITSTRVSIEHRDRMNCGGRGELRISLNIVLSTMFSVVENVLEDFKRQAREQLAIRLSVPPQAVTIVKVEPGSIIIEAHVAVPEDTESEVVSNVMSIQNQPPNATLFTYRDGIGHSIPLKTKQKVTASYFEEEPEVTEKPEELRDDDDDDDDDDDLAILIVACILLGIFMIFIAVLILKSCCKKKQKQQTYTAKQYAYTNGIHDNGEYYYKSSYA